MPIIESIEGTKTDMDCIGCAIISGKVKSKKIFDGKHFEAHQDYEIPIKGFFVIASKRHIIGFADFNDQEKQEFIDILCKLRKGMQDLLNIQYVWFLHREDIIKSKVNPSHFHIALLPRYDWMKDKGVFEILEYARENMKTEKNLKEVDKAIKKIKDYMKK